MVTVDDVKNKKSKIHLSVFSTLNSLSDPQYLFERLRDTYSLKKQLTSYLDTLKKIIRYHKNIYNEAKDWD